MALKKRTTNSKKITQTLFQRLGNFLFTVADAHLDTELLVDVLGQVLGTIDGTILRYHVGEVTMFHLVCC